MRTWLAEETGEGQNLGGRVEIDEEDSVKQTSSVAQKEANRQANKQRGGEEGRKMNNQAQPFVV